MADPISEREDLGRVLELAARAAERYLGALDVEPAAPPGIDEAGAAFSGGPLPEAGDGAVAALTDLIERGIPAATRSAGPRFFHFVTGGATPAALAADWLASALDQNSFSWVSSPLGSRVERVAVEWLKELFDLPADWGGVLTTGATGANLVGLAAARRWWALEQGVDLEESGWAGLPAVPVLATPSLHSSAVKALAVLGIGRERVQRLDLAGLDRALRDLDGAPAILIATAGDVNTGGFDPIAEMAALAHRHHAWLHVDGAFGLFARASTQARELAAGVEQADSVISDGHKWLNVPYDCGFAFVRDPALMHGVFALTGAPYLPAGSDERPSFGDRGPEASRRARALAVWATLRAHGRAGYRDMVDRHLELARRVGAQVEAAPDLELLAPVQLNVVCFRYRPPGVAAADLDELNRRLAAAILADGRVYFGTTVHDGRVAFRPAISNWRTRAEDVDLIVEVTRELGARLLAPA
jgi:glutamate/tyrosine decarboxylase-like PLP-dependent enzyme